MVLLITTRLVDKAVLLQTAKLPESDFNLAVHV